MGIYATFAFFGEIIAVTEEASPEILVSGYFISIANLTKETADIIVIIFSYAILSLVIIVITLLVGIVEYKNKE